MANAKTYISIIADGFSLSGGQTHHWRWNNANKYATHGFQVIPINGQNNSHLLYKAQVQNVRSLLRNDYELELYFDVHNWGGHWADYRIIMSTVTYA